MDYDLGFPRERLQSNPRRQTRLRLRKLEIEHAEMQGHYAAADIDAYRVTKLAVPGIVALGRFMVVTGDGQQRTKAFDRFGPFGIAPAISLTSGGSCSNQSVRPAGPKRRMSGGSQNSCSVATPCDRTA